MSSEPFPFPVPEPALARAEVERLERTGVRIHPAAPLGSCRRCGTVVRYGDGRFEGRGRVHLECRAGDLARIDAGRRRAARFALTLRSLGVEVPLLGEHAESRELLMYLIELGRTVGESPVLDVERRVLALRWCAASLRRLRRDPRRAERRGERAE